MTDEQPKFLALYARYDDLQQPEQAAEELAINFHLLFPATGYVCGTWMAACLYLTAGCRFLLRYGIVDTVDESQEQSHVDADRNSLSVLQVCRSEIGQQLLCGPTRGKKLRLGSHLTCAAILRSENISRKTAARNSGCTH